LALPDGQAERAAQKAGANNTDLFEVHFAIKEQSDPRKKRKLRNAPVTPDGKMPGESRSSPREIQNYLGRISGPLLDCIDLHIEVPQVKFRDISAGQTGGTSAVIRGRVVAARQRQQAR